MTTCRPFTSCTPHARLACYACQVTDVVQLACLLNICCGPAFRLRCVQNRIVDQGSEEFMSTLMPAGLKITMCTPCTHNRQPCVQFMKHGALNDDELAVFSAVLRSANLVTADKVAAVAAQVGSDYIHGAACLQHQDPLLPDCIKEAWPHSCEWPSVVYAGAFSVLT